MEEKRVCPRCLVEKPLTTEFWHVNRTKPNGFQVYCKECKRTINIDRYHTLSKEKPVEDPDREKVCTRCKVPKPLTYKNWPFNGYGWSSHCRSCRQNYLKNLKRKYRRIVLEHYSGGLPKCACCGEEEPVFLAVDHINGGGRKHHQEVGTSGEFYKWFIDNNFPEGFRILCHNCNMAFGQLGYCPHNPPTTEGDK